MERIQLSELNSDMINAGREQEAPNSTGKSWYKEFPVFQTPLNSKVLVWMPEDFDSRVVEMLVHDCMQGKQYAQFRCINGLHTGFEQFGYTGDCPLCACVQDSWQMYNVKLDAKAKELGVDRENDPDNILKGVKDTLLREMAVKNPDKYVCFPVVVIPSDKMGNPDFTSGQPLQPYYVVWRKQRYEDKFSADVLESRTSPAGTFQRWSFTYDTKGQQPTAMLSAKALKVKIIENQEQLGQLNQFVEACRQVIAPFTQSKAVDAVKACNFLTYASLEHEAEKCIKTTRLFLAANEAMQNAGNGSPAIGGAAPAAPQLGTANAAAVIAGFGQASVNSVQTGVQMGQIAPNPQLQPSAGVQMGQITPQIGQTAPNPQLQPSVGVQMGQVAPASGIASATDGAVQSTTGVQMGQVAAPQPSNIAVTTPQMPTQPNIAVPQPPVFGG